MAVAGACLFSFGCGSDDGGGSGGSGGDPKVYPTEELLALAGFDAQGPAPFGIALEDSHVYVSVVDATGETGSVFRMPKKGGTIEPLTDAGSARALALDGTLVLFDDEVGGSILSVPKDGGDVMEVTSESSATDMAASGGNLVFTKAEVNGTSFVGSVPTAGGTVTTLLESDERPVGVAIRGERAYLALLGPGDTTGGDGEILSAPVSGGDTTRVAPFLEGPRAMVVDDGMLYATLQGFGYEKGEVISVSLPDGEVRILANNLAKPWGLAADETHLYWVNRGNDVADGTVMKMPKEGDFPEILADAQGDPRQVAVDGSHVYWTNYRTGEVMRVPKVQEPDG